MSDPITSKLAEQAANQAAQQQQQTASVTEINVHDQSRFEDALNSSVEQTGATADVTKSAAVEGPDPTLGDAILNGLEKMKTSIDGRSARIENQLANVNGDDLSVQDCVKLQFEVMQMGLEQELTGKIADKTSQGVQTLFKNQ